MIITREILEHYLRATGWQRGERGFWIRGAWQIGTFEGMAESEIAHQITRLAQSERKTVADLVSRLAYCASANVARLQAYHAVQTDDQRVASRLGQLASHLLHESGVDPERWEAARCP